MLPAEILFMISTLVLLKPMHLQVSAFQCGMKFSKWHIKYSPYGQAQEHFANLQALEIFFNT